MPDSVQLVTNLQTRTVLDLDSSKNVVIRNSAFFAHDDGIAIKSGKDWWGRDIHKPSENILIENVSSSSFVGASFAVGSETSGGIRNITVRDLRSAGTELGLSIKSERGRGSTIEDVHFEDVVIAGSGCAALQLNLQYHTGIPPGNATTTPRMQNITFTNVLASEIGGHPGFCMPLDAKAQQGLTVGGLPQPLAIFQSLPESPLASVRLNNVSISGPKSSAAEIVCVDASVARTKVTVDGRAATITCS